MTEISNYERMGIAAMLPGMVHAVEIMQTQINAMRERLALLESGAPRRGGRPRTRPAQADDTDARGVPLKSDYWRSMTPEQRSAEMRRRFAKRASSKATHPRDPEHPDHEAWARKTKRSNRKFWDSLSPRQRKQKIAAMAAARAAKRIPSVKLNGHATEANA